MKNEINLSLIKEKRLAFKLTNKDMAKALGLKSPTNYLRREEGEYNFKVNELPVICKKLKIPLEKIFE